MGRTLVLEDNSASPFWHSSFSCRTQQAKYMEGSFHCTYFRTLWALSCFAVISELPVVGRSLVLEDSATQQHNSASDGRVQEVGRNRSFGVEVVCVEVYTAEKMIDALLLDQTNVVG